SADLQAEGKTVVKDATQLSTEWADCGLSLQAIHRFMRDSSKGFTQLQHQPAASHSAPFSVLPQSSAAVLPGRSGRAGGKRRRSGSPDWWTGPSRIGPSAPVVRSTIACWNPAPN